MQSALLIDGDGRLRVLPLTRGLLRTLAESYHCLEVTAAGPRIGLGPLQGLLATPAERFPSSFLNAQVTYAQRNIPEGSLPWAATGLSPVPFWSLCL